MGERLGREHRLRLRSQFLACYRRGRRRHGVLAVLHFVPNSLGFSRLGITASRKVGKAVVRQRVKRRVREIFRRDSARAELGGVDVVVHLRPEAGRATFGELADDLRGLLGKLPRSGG